jgi:hypothetical protein
MPIQISINQPANDFELISMNWNDLYLMMMSFICTKRVLERRQIDHPNDPSIQGQINSINKIIDEINRQYPNWQGGAFGLLDNSLGGTLTEKGIWNERRSII